MYLLINVNKKCVWLICSALIAVSQKYNAKRHFLTVHEDYISKYPDECETRRRKLRIQPN
jgi:hypothetical protein